MDLILTINVALVIIILLFALIIIYCLLNPPRDQAEIMEEAYAGLRGQSPCIKQDPNFSYKD